MICSTSGANGLLKSAIPRNQSNTISICRPTEIFDYIQIDPASKEPRIDAFVVSSADVNKRNVSEQFMEALKHKHIESKVIYICNARKADMFCDNRYIDKYLIKPRGQELAEAIFSLSAQLTEKPIIHSSAEEASKLTPRDVKVNIDSIFSDTPTFEDETSATVEEETTFDENPFPDYSETEDYVQSTENKVPELAERIKKTQSVAEVATLMREVSAEKILKDVAKDNASYVVIENKLQAIKEEINSIMLNNTMKMEDKLSKIRSVIYDKKFFALQSNTIIEQYVSEIIDTFTMRTLDLLKARLKEIDESIKLSTRYGAGTQNFGRLTGINEERASVIMELNTLKAEIQEIGSRAADVLHTLTSDVAASNSELSGNNIVDSNLRAHGSFIIDGDSIEIIRKILQTANQSTEEFKEAVHYVTSMLESYNKIIQLDKEQIAATNEIVSYLQANNIEDTVVANTLLKQSLRVFTGAEGVGRSIVPYMLSKKKSRTNNNVLLVDLTGTCKYDDYGVDYYTMEDYKANRYEKDFVVVVGTCTSVQSAQNLNAILTRAADYYRVINIVLPMDNKDVFDVIAHDVRCVNYLTNTKKRNMESTKSFMCETVYENVAKRLIVNDASSTLKDLASYFDLLDRLDCQLLTIPHIAQVEVCSLKGIDPLTIDYVNEKLVEVSEYA